LYYLSYTTIWHQASLIKRELFTKIGMYNESYKIASDWDFWLRSIIVNKCSLKYLPIPFSIFDTTGIGSNKKYNDIALKEKKDIYLSYFSLTSFYFYRLLHQFEGSLVFKMYRKVYRIFVSKRTVLIVN